MQFKLAIFTTLFAAATLAAATAMPSKRYGAPEDQCNTGDILCCNTIQSAGSTLAAVLLEYVGTVVDDATVPIGITCSSVSVIGIGGNSCTAQPVCCMDNSFNGIVAIGCTPVNANL